MKHQQILIIENIKVLSEIEKQMKNLFDNEEKSRIHLVSNFDYYFINGDFNTKSILDFFQKDLQLLNASHTMIRTWAHVEWTSTDPDEEKLNEFESSADDFVIHEKMLSVCAYSDSFLSDRLNKSLEKTHKYVMTDDEIYISTLYSTS